MSLNSITPDVINIADVTVSVGTDALLTGILNFVTTNAALKATIANPTFTGYLSVPNMVLGYNSYASNTKYVTDYINTYSYGLSAKASGPKIFMSALGPSGGAEGDFWMQF